MRESIPLLTRRSGHAAEPGRAEPAVFPILAALQRSAALPALVLLFLILPLCSCARKTPAPLVPDGYSSWPRTTPLDLTEPIPGHEDRGRRIFVNVIGENFTHSEKGGTRMVEFPGGTIIVKEIYDRAPDPFARPPIMLTVMKKDPDDPRSLGGWLWIVKDLSTGNEQVMTNTFCVTCHANANESHPYGDKNPEKEFRDYVFYLPER